ncbi:polyamine aminopropyltransferase [Aromatoleum petrolei]|uniref:Polyamine aminopropyltransferase n=1 Tax=Aromatoleum petrolei TaxID=76116 RepID=A0ABX1MJ38_9RHOO|nr:polyamine aminopropyltransferase [Aromatoleum petrolei]NMF87953.1 polyamine aminopropyltransferase [Aromatoleum petrolei]QTQ36679.1 Polyamine aminopropyltransferase [Aromatoleum petrolei]
MKDDETPAVPRLVSDALVEELDAHYGFFCRGARLLEQGKSPYQRYEVWDTPTFGTLFRLDGSLMSAERDEFVYHENLVHVSALSHPAPCRALVVGGGDGGSARELLRHPGIERVVVVELDETVVALSRRYLGAIHQGAFDDPRTELHIGNGLDYVRAAVAAGETFDLIVLDLTEPERGPAAALYREPFFADCRALLHGQGALTLHLGAPWLQAGQVRALVQRLRGSFAIVRPYFMFIPLYGGLWGLACASDRVDPLACPPAAIDAELARRGIAGLRYYNGEIHAGQFALPNFVRELLA